MQSRRLIDDSILKISQLNKHLNAFVRVIQPSLNEACLEGPLKGIPIGIKDNILVAGELTQAGSAVLQDFIPEEDAACVKLLKRAGGIVVGKTNMDEFGMGSHSVHSKDGPVRNPRFDLEAYSAGGSSGGSAAAVAAGLVPLALGSDTGGSVRLPASYCGVIGFKPSYGRISRHGLVSYASSLDTVGIISGSMDLLRTAFDVLKESSDGDMTAWQRREPIMKIRKKPQGPLTIGIVDEMFPKGIVSSEAFQNVEILLERLEGVRVKRVSLPSLSKALWAYYVLSMVEAASCLARYSGRYWLKAHGGSLNDAGLNSRFGAEVQRRLVIGNAMSSAEQHQKQYQEALHTRESIRAELQGLFDQVDMIVSPTAATGPPVLKDINKTPLRTTNHVIDVEDAEWATDILTVPASLAGIPAISVPVGPNDLPSNCIGVQLMAPNGRDEELLGFCLEELQ